MKQVIVLKTVAVINGHGAWLGKWKWAAKGPLCAEVRVGFRFFPDEVDGRRAEWNGRMMSRQEKQERSAVSHWPHMD